MFDGIAEQGPDLGPQGPIHEPDRQHRGADGGENIPRDGFGDGGVAEEGHDNGKAQEQNPKRRRGRPRMQLRSLFFPILGFRIRQVQESDGNEDWGNDFRFG